MAEIWFGTRGYMQWVPAPAVNVDASKTGWQAETTFINGGAAVRRSVASHKRYSLAWNLTTRERIRAITDYADGIYGTGPIYWADPFAMDTNMLPAYWAAPFMGIKDGPILSGAPLTRPTSTPTPANIYGYPVESALYTVGADTKPEVWIPIPPGYTAWVGAHGANGTGGTVVATPTTGAALGTPTTLTLLAETTDTRVNYSVDSGSGDGVLLKLGGTGTVRLSGIIVQVLRTGVTPATGGFISGQGHSGCSFLAQPTLTQYNAVLDRVGLSAELVETQAWR